MTSSKPDLCYGQILKKINDLALWNNVADLEKFKKLHTLLLSPAHTFKSVHIAGTNGKGSVSTKIAYGLQYSGYKVGLYTSPHILSFRERIKINGRMILKKELIILLSHIFQVTEEHHYRLSFFEATTLLAFLYFAKKKIDIAVIETGLGGRLDATNIINPILSAITTINFDHMKILGNTLDEIANEKAGIIKEKTPLFIGPKADFHCITSRAQALRAPIYKTKEVFGFYDLQNSEIANNILSFLKKKFEIQPESIKRALRKRPPCRFEIYTRKHKIAAHFKQFPKSLILDVAHNIEGFTNLFETIAKKYAPYPIRALMGMCKDKEIAPCATLISKYCNFIYLVDSPHPRLAKKEELAKFFDKEKISFSLELLEAFKRGVKDAAEKDEILIVCGSFFIMHEIKMFLNESIKKIRNISI